MTFRFAAGILLVSMPVLCLLSSTDPFRLQEKSFALDFRELPSLDPFFGIVPGRSLPFSPCDITRDDCGEITPSESSIFIADGAFNTVDSTAFFVEVSTYPNGIFQLDLVDCSVVPGSYGEAWIIFLRGIAFDEERYEIWCCEWGDNYIYQLEAEPPYYWVQDYYTFIHGIASMAVDQANDYLFVGTNAYPDMLHVYDISAGYLGSLLGSWAVPWQTDTDGYDMAGMGYDDDSGQLVVVNQYAGGPGIMREIFDFDMATGLSGAGHCSFDATEYPWGVAVIEDGDPTPGSFSSYVADIGDPYYPEPPFDVDEYGAPPVFPPSDLACTVTADGDVELAWTNAEDYDEVNVYRDGGLIAVLPGSSTGFLDIAPGVGTFGYGVSGVIGADESSQVECDVIIYPGGGEVCFDFDSSGGGWVAGGIADWEWGTPSWVIDGNAWETNIGTDYFNSSCGWLDSPLMKLGSEGGWLHFDSYTSVECSWDGWNVQISADGGAPWSMIYPVEGYDQGEPYGSCDQGLGGDTNCGTAELETWNFDLTGYPGTWVSLRFLFESDESVAHAGVIIDNVCIHGCLIQPPHHRIPLP